jgi:fumarate reductase subunit C
MLCVYLPALLSSDKGPYQDRDFLIIFNVLLIGVLALIFFSISEHTKSVISKTNTILLFSLTSITIIINCIALSAIIFRIVEWGFTPNRLAVMGGNLVILINLLLIAYGLFRSFTKDENIELVEKRITGYLPLYGLWAGVVTFLFPLIFKFA